MSQREIEILRLVATGATNQQIAVQLDITLNTVKVHLRNIFAKIGVTSRTEASLYAVRRGLVALDIAAPPELAATLEADELTLAVADTPPAPAPDLLRATTPAPEIAASPSALVAAPVVRGDAATTDAVSADPPVPVALPAPVPRRRWLVLTGFGGALAVLLIGAFVVTTLLRTPSAPPTTPTPQAANTPLSTPDAWQQRALMALPRVGFGLVAFDDKVYVVGGTTAEGVTGALERYNPQSNTWTQLTAMPTPARDVQAAFIGGKLYVAGGQLATGAISNQFQVYDPTQDRWSTLPALPEPRSQYAVAALDGKLYIFGGWDGTNYQGQVWQFDPDLEEWRTRAALPSPRGSMSATVIGSRIHLIGGRNADGPVALHQSYDPAQDRDGGQPWRVLAPLPQPLEHLTSVNVLNMIYSFDAVRGTLLVYDPSSETWSASATQLPTDSVDLAAVPVDTRVYLLGNADANAKSPFHLAFEVIYRSQIPLISR